MNAGQLPFLIVIFLWCIRLSDQATTIAGIPIVNTLKEGASDFVDASTKALIKCTSDVAGSPVAVSLVSVTPPSPCGRCFQVYPNPGGTGGDFRLNFLPSQGTVSFEQAKSYAIRVRCIDNSGLGSSETNIDVRIKTNEQPTFTGNTGTPDLCTSATGINAKTAKAGDIVYSGFRATDPDGDPIFFTLTFDPPSNNFEIGENDGIVRAKNDLATECRSHISFSVTITDKKNPVVGPRVITCKIGDFNQAPIITNINRAITVKEERLNQPATTSSILAEFTYRSNNRPTWVDVTTIPANGVNFFEVDPTLNSLRLRRKLNYESGLQRINVTIKPNNGFCAPKTHYLVVTVIDCNDRPTLSPTTYATTLKEGTVLRVDAGFSIEDEDRADSHTYSIIQGNNNNMWSIDSRTGIITSTVTYDRDPPNNHPASATLVVQVKDRKGELEGDTASMATATVKIFIEDINDNPPIFTQAAYFFTVTQCTPLGTEVGNVLATDVDTVFNQNNVISYDVVSNEYIQVAANGRVYLKKTITAGDVKSIPLGATDYGKDPRRLRSKGGTTVMIRADPCPTTTTAAVPTTQTSKTVPPVTVQTVPTVVTRFGIDSLPKASESSVDDVGSGYNLAWIVAAAIAGAILLVLLPCLIFRYCMPFFANGGSCCPEGFCQFTKRMQTNTDMTRVVTPPSSALRRSKVKRKTVVTPPSSALQRYRHPRKVGDFDFWKERYPDDNYFKPNQPPVKYGRPLPAEDL